MVNSPVVRSAANWLAHWASLGPDETALVIEGVGTFTFGELAVSVASMAKLLAEAGMPSGALVGIESADQHAHIIALLASDALGACTVSFSADDLARGDALVGRCDWLLSAAAPRSTGLHQHWVRLDDSFADRVAATLVDAEDVARLTRPVDPDKLTRITRSSGTTGDKKAFGHSMAQLTSHLIAREKVFGKVNRDVAAICLYQLPTYVAYHYLISGLYNGNTICMISIENFDRVVAELPKFFVDVVQGQLPLLIEKYTTGFQWSHWRFINIIGAQVPVSIWEHLYPQRFARAYNGYSTSEMNAFSFSYHGDYYTILDDAEARIVDDHGHPVAPGAVGMIEIRSPRMARGYLWNPELTQKHFVDGWFRTFDLGCMPAPGQLVVAGRGDDVINIGGIKVMPSVYETRLRAIAGVRDAVLIGIPDQNQMTQLHVVVEGDGLTMDAALMAAIRQAVAGTCDDCWAHAVEKMPRTETGKVRRGVLRDMFAGSA